MGRRDEKMAEAGMEGEKEKQHLKARLDVAQKRLQDVPLSKLTVGDLMAIIQIKTRHHTTSVSWSGPYRFDVETLEMLADKKGV